MKENFIYNYHIIGNIYCDNVWEVSRYECDI